MDREWEARLRRAKVWLGKRSKRAEAIEALAGVSDPSAVRSVWRVFVADAVPNHQVAVMLLGQIDSRAASRGLALIAALGQPAAARQAAIETLRRRDPMEFADVLIRLIRDPIRFKARPVGGPGQPGSLTVRGADHDLELIFAPPPPPDLPLIPGEEFLLDSEGGPILFRHTDTVGMPFFWIDDHGCIYASGAFIPPHCPVTINLGQMWRENEKTAVVAQRQLDRHVEAVKTVNTGRLSENTRIVQILHEVTGEFLPAKRDAWEAWWSRRTGRTRPVPLAQPRSVMTDHVPLEYLPKLSGALGYDPAIGYFVLRSTSRN